MLEVRDINIYISKRYLRERELYLYSESHQYTIAFCKSRSNYVITYNNIVICTTILV